MYDISHINYHACVVSSEYTGVLTACKVCKSIVTDNDSTNDTHGMS